MPTFACIISALGDPIAAVTWHRPSKRKHGSRQDSVSSIAEDGLGRIVCRNMADGMPPENPREFKVGSFTERSRTDESESLQRGANYRGVA